ncbi:MAG: kinase [Frankiales bacterium]|nr:kinase [Frankiales bacterium]
MPPGARPTPRLLESAALDASVRRWLDVMPERVADVAARWRLELGDPFLPGGHTAWVAPARTRDGDEVVLKVGMRHREADDEATALRLWDGSGAVRLHREELDDDTLYLLLERCVPGAPLSDRSEPEQDEVIASVLRRTWAAAVAPTTFRPLAELCAIWADETEERLRSREDVVDAGLAREAIAVLRQRPTAQVVDGDVVLCTDLHAGNVLSAHREPWLVVDPKPYAGEAAYDLVQHLFNCRARLTADPAGLTGRLAALADVDAAAVRTWVFARGVTELFWWPDLLPVVRALAP